MLLFLALFSKESENLAERSQQNLLRIVYFTTVLKIEFFKILLKEIKVGCISDKIYSSFLNSQPMPLQMLNYS